MGVFDQAANYAYRAEPHAVTNHLLKKHKIAFVFRELYETRTTPLPAQRDRTADKIVILDDPAKPTQPWLLLWEFQSSHDPDKLDVTLSEVGRLRTDFRWGSDRRLTYNVLAVLVYLKGQCPVVTLDMTAGEFGTSHRPLIWNVCEEQAIQMLDAVRSGRLSWGMLFWIPLMQGGGDPVTIESWKDTVSQVVSNRRDRADLGKVAMVFAESAGCRPAWDQALRGWDMVESQLFLEWTAEAKREGEVNARRTWLLKVLESRFTGTIPADVREMIVKQDNLLVLDDWHSVALRAFSMDVFRAHLMR